MVFFICDHCNETLKKNQVDKHCFKCRMCESVTCVDCSVTFYGNDYAVHTTCVSEAEKYEKSLYKPKQGKTNPQVTWMDSIQTAIASSSEAPASIRGHLQALSNYDNIPRNKKKFDNMVKNSLKIHNQTAIDSVWDFIQMKVPKTSPANSNNNSNNNSNSSNSANVASGEDSSSNNKRGIEEISNADDEVVEDK